MRTTLKVWLTVAALGTVGRCWAQEGDADAVPEGIPSGYRLVYSQDFEGEDALSDFEFTYPAGWRIAAKGDTHCLEFFGRHQYRPKVRSPFTIGLLSGWRFGDMVLEADVLQTGRDYGHRDMCFFFGFRDAGNFYYCHLATKADQHAHNIFVVKDAPRTKIADRTTSGIDWGRDVWHRVRLVRRVEEGLIEVYYDDMTTPIMVAEDTTHGVGSVGFGSFDDSGMVDNVRIYAPSAERHDERFFRPAADR